MTNRRGFPLFLIALLCAVVSANAATRVKDIASIQGVRGHQMIGYGLVVGLGNTGDTQRSTFTIQSVTSMLKRFGITVPQTTDVRMRNVAAVMVTATAPSFSKEGGIADVIVSSMGDATSLEGGTLLMTPLSGVDGAVYAMAQGPLAVGGYSVRAFGTEMRRNHTAAGRVPGGAILERALPAGIVRDSTVSVNLAQADFTTASRIAAAINASLGEPLARAMDASTVVVNVPPAYRNDGKVVEFLATVESLEITPDVVAKVVVNERTGTIVVGGNVSILPVAISHGGLNIEVQATPIISQPMPWSAGGQTVVSQMASVATGEDSTSVVAIDGVATVQDVARALNTLHVTPRDIISIFQALKEAGALKAELVII
jgi:flagellar P-ring protein FlgI